MNASHVIDLASALIGFLGTLASIWGTYFLTRFYHPFSPFGFFQTILAWTGQFLRFNPRAVMTNAIVTSHLGEITPERRAQSLVGIYWIFIGFVLQSISLLLMVVAVALEVAK